MFDITERVQEYRTINLHLKVSLPLPQAMGTEHLHRPDNFNFELPDTHNTPNCSSLLQLCSQRGFLPQQQHKPEVKVQLMTFAIAFCKTKGFYPLVLSLSVLINK